jgi:hypothetical protein
MEQDVEQSLLELCCYETKIQPFNELSHPAAVSNTSNIYQTWHSSKRRLTESDVIDGHWVKSCPAGYITELTFNPNGEVNEYRLFDRFHTQGTWRLDNGLLCVSIAKGDNRYTFNVVGNASINIHSAIERKNNKLHAYLKLVQVK